MLQTAPRREPPLQRLSKAIAEDSKYTLEFMRGVFLANKSTGAIAPSGRVLADRVSDYAELDKANVIVEFGPGTGVFTEAIERKRRPGTYFCALEVNESFVQATRKRCPDTDVIHDSAQNVMKHLELKGFTSCDVIVSGLPWTRFDDELQDSILHATYEALRPGGKFVTFAYSSSPLVPNGRKFFKDKLRAKFQRVWKSDNIWNNFPPAVVFVATKHG
jgi:phosphatidylethanolamine/phosphatidyl-N-methylethanolamine N-methyltransferase